MTFESAFVAVLNAIRVGMLDRMSIVITSEDGRCVARTR